MPTVTQVKNSRCTAGLAAKYTTEFNCSCKKPAQGRHNGVIWLYGQGGTPREPAA